MKALLTVWMLLQLSIGLMAQPIPPPARPFAITHVMLIDGTGAPPRPDQTVVVVGNRITACGNAQEVSIPSEARVIDATGKFLIPGLWDMHTHISDYPGTDHDTGLKLYFPMFLANGVTGIRDMAGYDIPWLQKRRAEVLAGSRLGTRLVITGRPLDGPMATDPGKMPIGDAASGRETVRKLKREGADFVKVYERLPREAYLAIAEECRKQGIPFAGHVPLSITAAEASEAGQRSMEHLGQGRVREESYLFGAEGAKPPPDPDPKRTDRLILLLKGMFRGKYDPARFTPEMAAWLASSTGRSTLSTLAAQWGAVKSLTFRREEQKGNNRILHYKAVYEKHTHYCQLILDPNGKVNWMADAPDTYSPAKAEALFARFVKNRTWQSPTLTALRGIAYRNDPAFLNDPRLKYVLPTVREMLQPKNDGRLREFSSAEWEWVRQTYQQDRFLVGKMRRAGVEFLAGTDAITDFCLPGFSLHDELALLVEAGLTPMEALQAATRNPARFLGREKELGTIERGKLADLVLLDADPLKDIRNTTKIHAVMANGRWLDRATLDAMLAQVEAVASGKQARP